MGENGLKIIHLYIYILKMKRLTSMHRCFCRCHLASRANPKPFREVMTFLVSTPKKSFSESNPKNIIVGLGPPGGGGYSRKFWIGVCRQGS